LYPDWPDWPHSTLVSSVFDVTFVFSSTVRNVKKGTKFWYSQYSPISTGRYPSNVIHITPMMAAQTSIEWSAACAKPWKTTHTQHPPPKLSYGLDFRHSALRTCQKQCRWFLKKNIILYKQVYINGMKNSTRFSP